MMCRIHVENKEKIVSTICDLLKSQNVLVIAFLFTNIPTLLTVLEDTFFPLIELFIDDLISYWDKIDKQHLLRACEWMAKAHIKSFKNHIGRLCRFFANQFSSRSIHTSILILNLI